MAFSQERIVPRMNEKPSFDCATAKTAAARLICADGELALLDGELGVAFQKRKAQTPASDQARFVAEQLVWIKDRNTRCELDGKNNAAIEALVGSKRCMVGLIQERIAFFTQTASAAPNISKVKQGMAYEAARAIILSAGWQASFFKKTILNEIHRDLQAWFIDAGFMEVEDCSPTGDALCVAEFHDAEGKRKLYVFTTSGSRDEIKYVGHDPRIVSFCIDKRTVNCEQPMDANQVAVLLDKRDPAMSALDEIAATMANLDSKQLTAALNVIVSPNARVASDTDSKLYGSLGNCAASTVKHGNRSTVKMLQNDCAREYLAWFPTCIQTGQTTKACAAMALLMARVAIEGFEKYCVGATAKDAARFGCL
jgi:uncharacterized protein YecT (DUF1311 family)